MRYIDAIDFIMGMTDYERPSTLARGTRARYDLDRIGAVLGLLEDPHLTASTVHIAGTKGKGSTSAMVSSVLKKAGHTPGLFTSPHLHTFRERIQSYNHPVPEQEFADLVEELSPIAERVAASGQGRVTVFELILAMAFHCFRNRKVGAQVIEVGLGGRLDATNLVEPTACGITALGLDHTEILGNTIEEIAYEKGGIIKPHIPVVCAPQQPGALSVIKEICEQRHSKFILAGEDINWSVESYSIDGQVLDIKTANNKYHLNIPLLGTYQRENAAVAIGIIEILVENGLSIGENDIYEGFREVEWPCRLEVLQEDPVILADGAHNTHSPAKLSGAITELFPNKNIALILGVSGNKDLRGLIGELAPLSPVSVVATRSRHPMATDPDRIAEEFAAFTSKVHKTDSVEDALELSLKISEPDTLILTTGSLFVAAEIREVIKGIKPEIYPAITR